MAEKSQIVQWVWICKHGIPGKMAFDPSTQILHECMHASVMYFLSLLAWCISEFTQKSSHAWSVFHTFLLSCVWQVTPHLSMIKILSINKNVLREVKRHAGNHHESSPEHLWLVQPCSVLPPIYDKWTEHPNWWFNCGDIATIIPLICAVFILRWCSTKWSKWVFRWLWL